VLRLLGDYAPLTLTGLGELLVCGSGTNPSRLVDRTVELGLVTRTTPRDQCGGLASTNERGSGILTESCSVGQGQE